MISLGEVQEGMENNAWKGGWKKITWEVKWRRKGKMGVEKKDDYRRKAERWRTW